MVHVVAQCVRIGEDMRANRGGKCHRDLIVFRSYRDPKVCVAKRGLVFSVVFLLALMPLTVERREGREPRSVESQEPMREYCLG